MPLPKDLVTALDLLPHLARCAREKRTITYGELGKLVGHPHFYTRGRLDVLRDRILPAYNLPRIDVLVVNKETQHPGESFFEGGRGEMSDKDYDDITTHLRE